MAGNIKGITIEFRGDTTKLDKAIRGINSEAKSLDKELKEVNRALKFNPGNTQLLQQKFQILGEKIEKGAEKLELLKQAQKELDAKNVDKNSKEYRELQREIVETESKQKALNAEQKKIKAALSPLGQFSTKMGEVGKKLESAGQSMKAFSAAGAAVVAGLGAISVKAAGAADDLNTLSKQTGIGTEELQKYNAISGLVDVSVETIAKSHVKLTKSMSQAEGGAKKQTAAFEKLGVSVTDSDGNLRDSEDVFQDTIKALGEMTNETDRDATAMAIFGKSASELNPLIEDMGESYSELATLMEESGLSVIDQETIDKANQFNDELDKIKATGQLAFQNLGMTLAGYLAPALAKVTEFVSKIAGWLSQLSPQTLAIIGVIAGVVAGLAPLLILAGKLATAISAISGLMAALGVSMGAVAGPVLIVIGVIAALIAIGVLLYKNWDKIKAWAVKTWTSIKDTIGRAVDGIKQKWEDLKNKAASIFNTIKDKVTAPIKSAFETIKGIIEKIKALFRGEWQLPKIKLPHFKIDGKFSISPPSVPKLSIDWYKNGAIFAGPSVIGVGEAGAEAVLPLEKLWTEMDKRFGEGGGAPVVNITVNAAAGMNVNELAAEVERRMTRALQQKRRAWA